MSIALTTNFDPGDHDAGQSYSKAKIVDISISTNSKKIDIIVDFGEEAGDPLVFTRGAGAKRRRFQIEGDDYDTFVAQLSLTDESLYSVFKRLAYAHIQTEDASLAGTVS